MKSSGLVWIIIFLAASAFIDWYVFQGIKTLTARNSRRIARRFIHLGYWGLSLVFFTGVTAVLFKSGGRFRLLVFLFVFFLFSYLPKLAFALFLALEDLYRLWALGFCFFRPSVYESETVVAAGNFREPEKVYQPDGASGRQRSVRLNPIRCYGRKIRFPAAAADPLF